MVSSGMAVPYLIYPNLRYLEQLRQAVISAQKADLKLMAKPWTKHFT